MSAKFDPTKPVQTRSGYPARIICRDRKGEFPIVALYEVGGLELPIYCREDGRNSTYANLPQPLDLVNVPEKRRLAAWVNLYDKGGFTIHASKATADCRADGDRLACIHIDQEYEVGQGL